MLTTPEAVVKPQWMKVIRNMAAKEDVEICVLALDEAHAVVQWYDLVEFILTHCRGVFVTISE